MSGPAISVVVVSYNTREITRKSLEAVIVAGEYLKEQTGAETEVIVVENGSTDGSPAMIKQNFKGVKVINPGKNTGFAVGNNLGMKQAKARLILLLNSDAFVRRETLAGCRQFMQKHPGCGVVGCRLNYPDGRLQPSAGYLPKPAVVWQWLLGVDILDKLPILWRMVSSVHPENPGYYARTRRVEWVMGAFMCIRKQVYTQTGGFDENYFTYMEEVEWSKRIADAGWEIWYTPEMAVIHLGQASSGFDKRPALAKEMQGLIYFYQKHWPKKAAMIRKMIQAGCLLRAWAFGLSGNRHLGEVYRGISKQL